MNLETINKWLDEEYGCSYTDLLNKMQEIEGSDE